MKKLTRRPTRFDGLTLGLDVHKRVIQWCLLDRQGDELDNERVRSSRKAVRSLIGRLCDLGPLQVTLEATGCFLWVYDLRELRIASRELRSITDERANVMRRMKSHLAQEGLCFSSSDWNSVVGWQRIEELIDSMPQQMRRQAVERLWERIKSMTEEQTHWREQIKQLSQRFDEPALIADQIPGFGDTLAPIVWAELGSPGRFRSAKAYAKATGITPGYRISAGRRQSKKITREGNAYVRWALTRAVVACLRAKRGPAFVVGNWVRGRLHRQSKKRAIVAAARKLAEAIWRLFHLGEAFDVTRAFGGTGR